MGLKPDRMSRDERMVALLKRQPLDRIPVFGFLLGFPAVNVGYAIADMYSDPQKAFDAMQWTTDQYGFQDIPWVSWSPRAEVEMPTGEYSQAPIVSRYPVTTEEEAWRLEMTVKREDGRATMKCAKLVEAAGGSFIDFPVATFTYAAGFCGVERLCRWAVRRPELAHRLLGLATRAGVQRVRHWVDTFGPERLLPFTAEPTASNQIISPKQFQEFVLPYIKELHEQMLSMGIKHILCHICGEQNLNLPYWAQVPMGDPGIVSFGHEVDIDVASRYFPDDIIMGNVEPAVIQTGRPEQVYELTRMCIEKGRKHPGGFMLAPGCELPPKSPPYNVWTMIKAVSDFGWYD